MIKDKRILGILLVALAISVPAFSSADQVKLSWQAEKAPHLAGYRIYYGTESGAYGPSIDVGDVSSYVIPNLEPGRTHYFAVTAYNAFGIESGYSKEAKIYLTMPSSPYRVVTNPPGLRIIADGIEYKTPKTFNWETGSSHTIEVPSPQVVSGKRYLFSSWSDSGARSHTVTAPSSEATYAATLSTQFALTTSVNLTQAGTVAVSPAPLEGMWYDPGQIVTLYASTNLGYSFRSWSGWADKSTLASVVMNGPKKIKANFKKNTYIVKTTVDPLRSGVVIRTPNKPFYFYGDEVTLTARPKSGYSFGGWTGDLRGSQNPTTIAMTENINGGVSFTKLDTAPLPDEKPLAMIGKLESPVDQRTVFGAKPIYGWALDGGGILRVALFVDGEYVCDIPWGGLREDIGQTYPDYPEAHRSGFALLWNYSSLPPGEHAIKVRVRNLEGEEMDLSAAVFVAMFHSEIADELTPQSFWLHDVGVKEAGTAQGVQRNYDLRLEWDPLSQGFDIMDIVPRDQNAQESR